MLKEVMTAEEKTVYGFSLMLVFRRLLMVYFSQEVGSVARGALRQVSEGVLAQSYGYCVKAGAHKLLFMANTVPSFVSA